MKPTDQDISNLKNKLAVMSGLAQAAVRRAIQAMADRDSGLASAAKEEDKAIDDLEMTIDEAAIELLTKASSERDVHLITIIMKIARELERVGDEATTISRRAFDLNQEPPLERKVDISRTAGMALKMLKEALDAFMQGNPAQARAIIPRDKEVDALNKQLQRDLAEHIMQVPAETTRCLNLMVISKSLERIADHATNIAEDAVYLYEGRDIRHTGKGKVRAVEAPTPR